jgi:glycosyltransferase involved in cell wall biosynthesis
MDPVTVLIPTANRPAMLRTALRSVAAQSALDAVAEIVVIENQGNRESESVCREFPQLPIRYFFRDPPIPPGYHAAQDALSRVNCQWLALLFDDDWWMERHLEHAIESLTTHSDAVASYAACLWTTGEEGYLTDAYGSFLIWFGCLKPMNTHRWVLDLSDLLVINLITTAFHYSSMVVKTDVFRLCLASIANGNPYDTDRLIPVELGRHGKVVCDSRPQVYVRTHSGREADRIVASGEAGYWWRTSTQQLFALADEMNIDVKNEFEIRTRLKPVEGDVLRMLRAITPIWTYDALKEKNIELVPSAEVTSSRPELTSNRPSFAKIMYRGLTPPFIDRTVSRLRRKLIGHRQGSAGI